MVIASFLIYHIFLTAKLAKTKWSLIFLDNLCDKLSIKIKICNLFDFFDDSS